MSNDAWYAAHPNIRRGKSSDPVPPPSRTTTESTPSEGRSYSVPTPSIPYTGNYLAGERRKIYGALGLGFLIRVLALSRTAKAGPSEPGHDPGSKGAAFGDIFGGLNLVGWAALVFILAVASDYETTAQISVALAFIIFLTIASVYGVDAFTNLQAWIGETPTIRKGPLNG